MFILSGYVTNYFCYIISMLVKIHHRIETRYKVYDTYYYDIIMCIHEDRFILAVIYI